MQQFVLSERSAENAGLDPHELPEKIRLLVLKKVGSFWGNQSGSFIN